MSRDEEPNEVENEPTQHPALEKAGFNSKWEYTKHIIKSTAITALKGAVIGAIAAGVLATPIGAIGGIGSWALSLVGIKAAVGTSAILSAASSGAFFGALAGGAIGLAKGFEGAEDAVEDMEQSIISKDTRAKQLAANAQMLEQSRQKIMAFQPQQAHSPVLPMQQPQFAMGNMNTQQGVGQGSGRTS